MFKLILIAILVFLLIRMIVQGVFSYYAGYYDNSNNRQESKREGDVTIERKPKLEKKISKEDGQYIDYEDIK